MKTILVDDMALDMQLLEMKCADVPDFEIVGKFTSPADAIAYAEKNAVDFALLDIDMPGMNGIELAMRLRALRSDVIIIFVTAHPRFAVEAALPFGWTRYVASEADVFGVPTFGLSAPAGEIYAHFGLTPDAIASKVAGKIGRA